MMQCQTLPMWRKLDTLLNNFFDGITLADLMASPEAWDNYVI